MKLQGKVSHSSTWLPFCPSSLGLLYVRHYEKNNITKKVDLLIFNIFSSLVPAVSHSWRYDVPDYSKLSLSAPLEILKYSYIIFWSFLSQQCICFHFCFSTIYDLSWSVYWYDIKFCSFTFFTVLDVGILAFSNQSCRQTTKDANSHSIVLPSALLCPYTSLLLRQFLLTFSSAYALLSSSII